MPAPHPCTPLTHAVPHPCLSLPVSSYTVITRRLTRCDMPHFTVLGNGICETVKFSSFFFLNWTHSSLIVLVAECGNVGSILVLFPYFPLFFLYFPLSSIAFLFHFPFSFFSCFYFLCQSFTFDVSHFFSLFSFSLPSLFCLPI